MDKKQFNIQEIDNGWMVSVNGYQTVREGIVRQPQVVFCSDFEEVTNVLKKNWPSDLTKMLSADDLREINNG